MSDSNLNSTTEAAETALGLTPGQKLTKDEVRSYHLTLHTQPCHVLLSHFFHDFHVIYIMFYMFLLAGTRQDCDSAR